MIADFHAQQIKIKNIFQKNSCDKCTEINGNK